MALEHFEGVEIILRDELENARERLERAKRDFALAIQEIPSGLPSADSVAYLQQAGRENREALRAFAVALRRFNGFILDGTVPDELER